MKESEKYRFWNFSRGERFAVILLLCCIVILLVVRFYGTTRQAEPEVSDFKQFETEISDFEKQISIKKDTVRRKKNSGRKKSIPIYRPREQSFAPVERESLESTEQNRDSGN